MRFKKNREPTVEQKPGFEAEHLYSIATSASSNIFQTLSIPFDKLHGFGQGLPHNRSSIRLYSAYVNILDFDEPDEQGSASFGELVAYVKPFSGMPKAVTVWAGDRVAEPAVRWGLVADFDSIHEFNPDRMYTADGFEAICTNPTAFSHFTMMGTLALNLSNQRFRTATDHE